MNIKKEYIEKTREYLKELYNKKNSIDLIEQEIEDLKRQDKYQEIDFSRLGFGSKKTYKDISDLVTYIKDKIFIKECEIEHINKKYDDMMLFLSKLTNTEKEIIEYRYFKTKKDKTRYKLTDVAHEISYSVASVKRIEKKVIEKIAVFKFKSDAIENDKLKVS